MIWTLLWKTLLESDTHFASHVWNPTSRWILVIRMENDSECHYDTWHHNKLTTHEPTLHLSNTYKRSWTNYNSFFDIINIYRIILNIPWILVDSLAYILWRRQYFDILWFYTNIGIMKNNIEPDTIFKERWPWRYHGSGWSFANITYSHHHWKRSWIILLPFFYNSFSKLICNHI